MSEQNIVPDMRGGLDALDGLIRRQNELLRDIRHSVPTQSAAASRLGPDPEQDAAGSSKEGADIRPKRTSYQEIPERRLRTMDSINREFFGDNLSLSDNAAAEPGAPLPEAGDSYACEADPDPGRPAIRQTDAEEMKRVRARRRFSGVLFYFVLAVIVFAALSLTGGSVAPRSMFGFSTLSVLSGSMQSEIPKGSLLLVRRVDPDTLRVGDDITYMYTSTASITHKIVAIYEDYSGDGQRAFQTKGVNNSDPDEELVPASYIVGKVIFHVPGIGSAALFLKAHLLLVTGSLAGICVLLILLVKTLRWMLRPEGSGESKKKIILNT